MKFQASRNPLVNALNLVKDGIANRTTNPILKTIYLEAIVPDKLIFRTTNGQVYIETTIKADVQESGAICVDSLITNLLPSFEEGKYENNVLTNPIKFSLNETKLVITQGRRKHQPVYSSSDEFPKKPEIKNYVQIDNQTRIELIEAVSRQSISIGLTEERRILQGFCFNPHLKYIVSSDGTRTTLRKDINIPGNIAILPARLLNPTVSKFNILTEKDVLQLSIGSPISGFKFDQYINDNVYSTCEIIVNNLDGEYPPTVATQVDNFLAETPALTVKVKKGTITKILEICKLYSDRAYNEGSPDYYASLVREQNEVKLIMEVPDLIKMEEPLDCTFEGAEEFRILFHPGLTLQAINECKGEVELRFLGINMPFFILDNSKFTYLQACMVVDNE